MLNTEQALNKFAKGVIKQSRANLTRKDKNVTRELYDSLKYDLKVGPNSFRLEIDMSKYGEFQDEGVKGANPGLVKNGVQKAPNSRFAFKNKMPPVKDIQKWVNARGLKLRDKKGRFAKGGAKTLAYLISRSIYAQGIKPSRFFTRAFETQYDRLPEELIQAFALDLDDLIKFTRQ